MVAAFFVGSDLILEESLIANRDGGHISAVQSRADAQSLLDSGALRIEELDLGAGAGVSSDLANLALGCSATLVGASLDDFGACEAANESVGHQFHVGFGHFGVVCLGKYQNIQFFSGVETLDDVSVTFAACVDGIGHILGQSVQTAVNNNEVIEGGVIGIIA